MDGSWKNHVRADEPSMTQPKTRSFFPSMKTVAIDTNQNQVNLSFSWLVSRFFVCSGEFVERWVYRLCMWWWVGGLYGGYMGWIVC